jgi:hypothetical protein
LKAPRDLLWLSTQVKDLVNATPTPPATRTLSNLLNAYRLTMLVQTGGGSAGRGQAVVQEVSDVQAAEFAVGAAACLRAGPNSIRSLVETQLENQAQVQPLVGAWSWETRIRRSLRRYPFNDIEFGDWRGAVENALSAPRLGSVEIRSTVAGPDGTPSDLITSDELADWMGIATKQIRTKEAQRWLQRNNLVVKYYSESRISVGALANLAAKLLSQSQPNSTNDDWITLQQFMQQGPSRWHLSVWQALDAAAVGRIGPLAWQSGQRLATLAFSKSGILRLAVKPKNGWPYVILTDAARQLQIYPDALRRAAKAGLISANLMRCPDGHYRHAFTVESWEEFVATYVFAGELARKAHDEPRRFSDKLKDEGIKPVSGPGIDGGLVAIFKKSDVEKIDLKLIAGKRGYRTNSGRPDTKTAAQRDAKRARLGWLDSTAASEYTGISVQRMASAVRKKKLKAVKHSGVLGNRRFFRRQDLDAYMAGACTNTSNNGD